MNKYDIDFSSWIIEAETEKAAVDEAVRLIHTGMVPNISSSEPVGDEDDEYNQPSTESQQWSQYK
jgi:hypothetical protein